MSVRTANGRFVDARCSFDPEFQKEIIELCKQYNQFTWKEFAEQFDISKFTLRYTWRNGKSTLPYTAVKKLIQLLPASVRSRIIDSIVGTKNPFWGQKVGGSRTVPEEIRLPSTDSLDFAEFYGILLGDGCVYSNLNSFCISSDSLLDKHYVFSRVVPLIGKLFGEQPKTYFSKTERSIRIIFNRKLATRFLVRFGFPRGKKSSSEVKIPSEFQNNSELLKACIRGLVDTDGSICPHPNSKIMLDLTTKMPDLLKSCFEAFVDLGLEPSLSQEGIYLYGEGKVGKYFKEIGSSNMKHRLKHNVYRKRGKVPNTRLLEEHLRKN